MEGKKLAAVVGAISLTVGALGGAYYSPVEVTKEVIVEKNVTVEKPVIEYVNSTVEVVKEVPVEKIVYVNVTNDNLADVLEHIYDNDGSVEYLVDDLDDDEVSQIADRIVFANEVKSLAVDAIEKDLFDELDDEMVGLTRLDEGDMERLRIDDDVDEIVIDSIDFEDSDADVIVTGNFEQDDVRYDFTATVVFKDGEYDELRNINVVLH